MGRLGVEPSTSFLPVGALGIEPRTSFLSGKRSTTEPRALIYRPQGFLRNPQESTRLRRVTYKVLLPLNQRPSFAILTCRELCLRHQESVLPLNHAPKLDTIDIYELALFLILSHSKVARLSIRKAP